ncbi:hypothetical protein [Telmatospirillum sp. J64-1]|uniref:hypothetical protein n=1 Tax=Telmatospirillum sp. J64-1 TaxID=2502183 RepID=UPI00115DF318|nr:hypothetical protein [Telmatospirillum sp. J64-1]
MNSIETAYCPCCGRQTRQRLVKDRVLATVGWCLVCYSVTRGEQQPEDEKVEQDWPQTAGEETPLCLR